MTHSTAQSRILIVDDDEKQLASMRRTLQGLLEIVTTTDPMQALKIFKLQGPFAVVISDYQMPLMNGVQLFAKIFEIDQATQRILITGRPELQMAIDAVNHGKITAFLTKPTPIASIRGLSINLCKHSYSRTQAIEYIQLNDLQNKSRTELISAPSFESGLSTFS